MAAVQVNSAGVLRALQHAEPSENERRELPGRWHPRPLPARILCGRRRDTVFEARKCSEVNGRNVSSVCAQLGEMPSRAPAGVAAAYRRLRNGMRAARAQTMPTGTYEAGA